MPGFEKTWGERTTLTAYDKGMFGLVCADFDDDRKIDMAVTNRLRNELLLFKHNGNGTFGTPQLIDTVRYRCIYPGGLAVGNINGDSQPDLSILCQHSGNILTLTNGN